MRDSRLPTSCAWYAALLWFGVSLNYYAFAQNCVVPPSGIISWWPLDETGRTTASDFVGNRPGVYVNNPIPAVGRVGNALRFNGSNAYLQAADSDLWAFGANPFTIELWANFDATVGGSVPHPGAIFIGNDEGPQNLNKWFFGLGGGFLYFHINSPTIGPKFFPLAPFSPVIGQWYHLAVTRLASTYTIFINGIAVLSAINTDVIPNSAAPLTIGQAEGSGFMNGLLDEITIYNRALSQSELQSIVSAGIAGKCKSPPFGSFDVPNSTTGLTNLAGAFAVGGWALSTITVANVGIWRDPIGTEPTASNGLVFMVNATMIAGSRPDVATAFPSYPNNNYGWGAQILTTGLPGTNGLPRGNGTYRLHAIATDPAGIPREIGTQITVSVNNTGSHLPFGTIDTPAQGGVASGTAYVNFGWILTPQPNIIPIDGSSITVYIDNTPVGHPTYNFSRCDVDFQGLRNSGSTDCSKNGTAPGPVGFFTIDTTKLTNGLHTIQWGVSDTGLNVQGIGSRFFIVQN